MKLPLNQIFGNHAEEVKVKTNKGSFDDRGIYSEDKDEFDIINMIVRPLSTNDIIHDENGIYSNDDIKVFTKKRLQTKYDKIEYNNNDYTIMEEKDNKFHGNYYSYIAKCEGEVWKL